MKQVKSTNIVRETFLVSRSTRENLMGHRGVTIWFTGLSASGKTTVATIVDRILTDQGVHCSILDGDNIRHGLCSDLGFLPKDRDENIRRVGEVSALFTQAGMINLVSFISPYREQRSHIRSMQNQGDFIEVHVDCSIEVCESRDPKGLYAKARKGEIKEFTGISAPYEPPLKPEIVLDTTSESPIQSALNIVEYLETHDYLSPRSAEDAKNSEHGAREKLQ